MSNKNLLTIDVPSRWNLTYVMITATWDKRKVLNVMAITFLKGTSCQKSGIFLRFLQINF